MGASDKELEEEKSRPYVIDASALYPLLLQTDVDRLIRLLPKIRVLDLTKYEVGNAARYDRKLTSAASLMEEWEVILNSAGQEPITNLAEVQKIAKQHSITFYDAAYVQVASHLRSKLVTMDREILEKFHGQAISLDELERHLKVKS
ncbi:MAG: type II toxin-antitoxin system VapC family toxin [Thaumarchaeota archaeon]|nr:type II toxin-antitoxin system VapC family toxin [Nitrososphaerota archaeon]